MSDIQGRVQESLLSLLQQELEHAKRSDFTALLDDIPSVDLQTLLAEMTALKAEVRAETTASREQREQLKTALQSMEESLQQAQRREESAQQQMERLRNQHKQQLVDAWIDALERVQRSLEKAQLLAKPKRTWWRTITNPAAESLAEGLALTQHHLLAQLRHLGISPIVTVGQPFDPKTMQAMGTVSDPTREDGVVVEELMPGYLDNQGIKCVAQVVVNRKKGT